MLGSIARSQVGTREERESMAMFQALRDWFERMAVVIARPRLGEVPPARARVGIVWYDWDGMAGKVVNAVDLMW